ncbi:hypothetical protein M408DRAFT_186029 [Serendipita vermifera MAFF 305830]|uniref:E3 ubiquitin-protein ligase listerin n=1 Tax=Serendipita vermifera MAFF 305830 TaxID=933852 RepID=A0A0C2X3G6_SERVB|nr:hypothetical protein M408DRAFT_186029 [Serendipita vermifera MAFF 305830]
MGKQKGSSATSGTRKKHARKAAGEDASTSGQPQAGRGKAVGGKGVKGKGKKNAEPRVKAYIPPVKPQALQQDPVDVLRLATSLPPDLLVIFRKLTKKDAITRRRALEELITGWVEKVTAVGGDEDEQEAALASLEIALPAWCYHFPALILHPSRRVRFLAATIQASFLEVPILRDSLWAFMKNSMVITRLEGYYGAWMISAHDIDRQVSQVAQTTWNLALQSFGPTRDGSDGSDTDREFIPQLESFLLHAIMHPQSLYTGFYPASATGHQAHPASGSQSPNIPDDASITDRGDATRIKQAKAQGSAAGDALERVRIGESEEERATDRDARIRIAALAALKSHIDSGLSSFTSTKSAEEEEEQRIKDLFRNPEFWSILYPGKIPPYVDEQSFEGFGMDQPGIRRSGWTLVHLLASNHLDRIQDMLQIISSAVLRSIWIEPDAGVRAWSRDGLLTWLSKVPEAWNLACLPKHRDDDAETSDEEEDAAKETNSPENVPYQEFLQFLRLGCGGSATSFYPAIVVVVSKLPESLFPLDRSDIFNLFDALWAAVDGHTLHVLERGSAPVMAFTNAHLETLVLITGRLHQRHTQAPPSEGTSGSQLKEDVVRTQAGLIWKYFVSRKLVARSDEFGMAIGKALLRILNIEPRLFDCAWEVIASSVDSIYDDPTSQGPVNIDFGTLFKSIFTTISPTSRRHDVVTLFARLTAKSLRAILKPGISGSHLYVDHLELMMQNLPDVIQDDPSLANGLQDMLSQQISLLSTCLSPHDFSRIVVAYLVTLQGNSERRLEHWHSVLSLVGNTETPEARKIHPKIVHELLVATTTEQFRDLRGSGELNGLLPVLLEQNSKDLIAEIIRGHGRLLSEEGLELCTTILSSQVEEASSHVLRQADYQMADFVDDAIEVLSIMRDVAPNIIHRLRSTLSGPLFVLQCIYPLLDGDTDTPTALSFWNANDRDVALNSLVQEMRSWMVDPEVCVSSEILTRAAMMLGDNDASWVLASIFPSRETLEQLFEEESATASIQILAGNDLLVPEEDSDDPRSYIFDSQQLSSYARLAWAMTCLIATDRQVAKSNMWMLKHSLLLQQMADDRLRASNVDASPLGPAIAPGFLTRIVETVQVLNVYLFSDLSSSELPHTPIIQAIETTTASVDTEATGFIIDLCNSSVALDYPKVARIVRSVLSHAFRGVSNQDADKWLSLARKLLRKARNTGLAIVSSIVGTGVESPLLTRLRNEAASDLAVIPAAKANTEGSSQLQLLLVLAPPLDSDTTFIPAQRAVMTIQNIEKWISSDEDIEPVIESRTIALLCHLAPILQSVVGRHWDFAFDLIENTLENSSLEDSESLVQLSRALDLISIVIQFGSTNKQLNAVWSTRRTTILRLVRDLISAPKELHLSGLLREDCRSRAIDILQDPPEGIIEAESLSKMVYLLQVPSLKTQKGAYPLVRSAAQKFSEKIVLEVGLNPTGEVDARLPLELMSLVSVAGLWDDEKEDWNEDMDQAHARFGTLLGWMVVLDAFENTSFRVRSSYVEQLRNSEIIQNALIPGICDLLQLGKPGKKPIKLDLWEVDNFIVSLYEHESARVLAAHVYYRALTAIPSLIRTWWTDCKDRQLSNAFATSTATYFSPVLVTSELSNLRDPSGANGREKLEDESLSIKVSQAISEVGVVYLVDEQQMEMAVKLPSEYPLKPVEVRDIRRVGVAEDKWRGWLFAVQQIVNSQNGHIADALALFKKNVTLHFEGQVECAICYSIISVTDLQLPTKPCKTCKNRFHASCLYKWFKSSSSSSCPLCRSDIF